MTPMAFAAGFLSVALFAGAAWAGQAPGAASGAMISREPM